ncbi:MAG: hypothetical protein QW054_01470 [Candidatus Micrarchaeia archaeon]
MKKIKMSKQNKYKKDRISKFGSVKNEEIINNKTEYVNPIETNIVIRKISDIEKRKELIKIAKKIVKEIGDEDPHAGGLLF